MEEAKKKNWCCIIEGVDCDPLSSHVFSEFHQICLDQLNKIGVAPDLINATGERFQSSKFKKFGGKFHQQIIESEFVGIQSLRIAQYTPADRDFHHNASMGLSELRELRRVTLRLSFSDEFIDFFGASIFETLAHFSDLAPWSYGYATHNKFVSSPSFFLMPAGHNKETEEERRLGNMWYATLDDERISRYRDVFPIMILNDAQLAQPVTDDQRLGDVMRSRHQDVVSAIGNLTLWRPHEADLNDLTNLLRGTPALVCQ